MSDSSTSKPAGVRILPRTVSVSRMVGNAAELSGEIGIHSLERLLGLLAATEGTVEVALQFGKDDEGRPVIEGEVAADLSVYCQRCLDAMVMPVKQAFRLGVVASEEHAQNLPEQLEPLMVTDDEVDLFELVADEIILALPIVSSHAEQCGEQKYIRANDEPRLAQRQTPFENLANLLGK